MRFLKFRFPWKRRLKNQIKLKKKYIHVYTICVSGSIGWPPGMVVHQKNNKNVDKQYSEQCKGRSERNKKTKQNALYANKIGTRQIHVKEINTDHEGHRTLFFRRFTNPRSTEAVRKARPLYKIAFLEPRDFQKSRFCGYYFKEKNKI